jgi:predicted nucleic acid-binding Zn ribbon protein
VSRGSGRRPDDAGPRRVAESLDAAVRSVAPQGASAFGMIFGRWEEIVGASVAAHVRPLRVTAEVLVVAVDHPAWATQVRSLGPTLLTQIAAEAGIAPARLEVVVRRS